MRLFPVIAATIVATATTVSAQGDNQRSRQAPPPPIYVKNTEVNVLVTSGIGNRAELALGYNRLGDQHPIGCDDDRGCLVTIASMAGINNVTGSWAICTLVDGVPTTPPCPHQNPAGVEGVGNGLASILLTKGHHIIETGVVLKDNAGALLGNWEVHYTMLLDPPHGH